MSLPGNLNTQMSLISTGSCLGKLRNNKSPRWKAGSILPLKYTSVKSLFGLQSSQKAVYLNTTTMGLSVFVTTARPFQIIRAEAAIVRIFKNCRATYKRVVSSIFPDNVVKLLSCTCRTFILRNSPNILFKLFI